ncbi:hypothetical protein HPG69_017686 [Diceros bicornis minor]|uniref:N-terminal Ras-GEF domain-containing protein n=1 Tax=Diceros bicornis minor TaxID=77932 RepID=A0A7J7FGZ0_DICBM|nr:hypothetical protein HPG69_017686 [Diceros bicornis minor]
MGVRASKDIQILKLSSWLLGSVFTELPTGHGMGGDPWGPLIHVPADDKDAPHHQQCPVLAQGVHVALRVVPHLLQVLHIIMNSRDAFTQKAMGLCCYGENSSAMNRNVTHKVWTVQASKLENDPTYVHTFLCTHRAFATTKLVLDLLFKRPVSARMAILEEEKSGTHLCTTRSRRYKSPGPHRGALGGQCRRKGQSSDPAVHLSILRTISCILGTWQDQYSEDVFQSPEFPCLKMLLAYLGLSMPGSLEHLEATQAETEGEEDLGWVMWVCGGDGAGPHRAEPPDPGLGPGAVKWFRSLSPWTTVWEDFLGVGSWTVTSVIGLRVFLCLRGTCRGSHVDDVFFSWIYSRNSRSRSRTTSRTSASSNCSARYSSEPQIHIQSPRRLNTQFSFNLKT